MASAAANTAPSITLGINHQTPALEMGSFGFAELLLWSRVLTNAEFFQVLFPQFSLPRSHLPQLHCLLPL